MARINRLQTTHACLPGLGYYSASRDGIGGREVGLYQLWFAGSELYLITYSHQRQDVRFSHYH